MFKVILPVHSRDKIQNQRILTPVHTGNPTTWFLWTSILSCDQLNWFSEMKPRIKRINFRVYSLCKMTKKQTKVHLNADDISGFFPYLKIKYSLTERVLESNKIICILSESKYVIRHFWSKVSSMQMNFV